MSRWKDHVAKWKGCQLCELCHTRKNVVLARGSLPASIVFVGEAPGPNEDALGKAFIGPAGKLLDSMIEQVVANTGYRPTIAWTNLVSCIPKDEEGVKFGEPPEKAIKACSNRLKEFVEICNPKLIVMVGKLSEKWTPKATERIERDPRISAPKWASIIHPAAVLRSDISQQGLLIQRCVITLQDAFEEIDNERNPQ